MPDSVEPTKGRSVALQSLIRARARATLICVALLSVLLTISLLLLSSFADFGSIQLVKGTPITIAVASSAGTIIFGAVIAISYIFWANSRLDRLIAAALSEIEERASN